MLPAFPLLPELRRLCRGDASASGARRDVVQVLGEMGKCRALEEINELGDAVRGSLWASKNEDFSRALERRRTMVFALMTIGSFDKDPKGLDAIFKKEKTKLTHNSGRISEKFMSKSRL